MATSDQTDLFLTSLLQLKRLFIVTNAQSPEERVATGLQFGLFCVISRSGELPMGDVATALSLSASSTTQLVERGVKAGLVNRKTSVDDRRVTLLSLTEQGKAELSQQRSSLKKRLEEALSTFNEAERQDLLRLTQKLVSHLPNH